MCVGRRSIIVKEIEMKVDKYDLLLANATIKSDGRRPLLENVYLHNGNLVAADGFILAVRPADSPPDATALLPASMLKTIKVSPKKQAELDIVGDEVHVTYKDGVGKSLEHEPTMSFKSVTSDSPYPDYQKLFNVPTEKTAQIAMSVSVLKKMLSCMPDYGILRIGIVVKDGDRGSTQPVEFECSNMDRTIYVLAMPMLVDWKEHHWYRPDKID